MKERYYIAYGSNLNYEQMISRCPDSKPVQIAWINGYRLLFKGSKTGNYLTIEKVKNGEDSRIPIVIYSISEEDEKALDRYEGYPHFYYKKNFRFVKNGKEMTAFAYIMDETRKIGIPSPYYIRTCREGYMDYGLDEAYLDEAIRYSTEHNEQSVSTEQERLWFDW